MHFDLIDANSRNNLKLLKNAKILEGFYLAGGTACAIHLGHRLSYDLDFFSEKKFDGYELADVLKTIGKLEISLANDRNFIGGLNGTKLSFIHYEPKLLNPPIEAEGLAIASLQDLVAMKLEAISARGRKRDFIDLHELMKELTLTMHDCLNLYRRKYDQYAFNEVHLLKSLRYFTDAEKDPMPEMKTATQWQEVKRFFLDQKYSLDFLSPKSK